MSEHTTSERGEARITALRRQGPENGPDGDGDGHPCQPPDSRQMHLRLPLGTELHHPQRCPGVVVIEMERSAS
jgi:hypothetical protein